MRSMNGSALRKKIPFQRRVNSVFEKGMWLYLSARTTPEQVQLMWDGHDLVIFLFKFTTANDFETPIDLWSKLCHIIGIICKLTVVTDFE